MISEYRVRDNEVSGREVRVEIVRSGRKSIGLEVRNDGSVRARIPGRLPDYALREFIEKHKKWLFDKLSEAESRRLSGGEVKIPETEKMDAREMERIKEKIVSRVINYSTGMGISFGKITVKNQKTRWGSCSSKGNLNFNYRIALLPEELMDYVIVHELAHRRHMNHSREFWQEVERYYPDYKECRRRLREIPIR